MDLEWRKHFTQALHEIRIVVVYSVITSVFTLSLQFIQWDFGVLISLIRLTVFFAIAHTEDRSTVGLPWPKLVTRLVAAIGIHYLTRRASLALKSSYLSGNLSKYESDRNRPWLILLTILLEFLDCSRFISSARIYILVVILLIIFIAPFVTALFQSTLESFQNAVMTVGRRILDAFITRA